LAESGGILHENACQNRRKEADKATVSFYETSDFKALERIFLPDSGRYFQAPPIDLALRRREAASKGAPVPAEPYGASFETQGFASPSG
jgi:hypothetical protein